MKLTKQLKPEENLFLIDWVSVSFRDDSNVTVDEILDVLCKSLKCSLTSFVHYDKGGLAGYNSSFRYLGESFLTVNYNVNNRKQGILVNLTGQGCRAFSKEDLFSFLKFGIDSNGYFTRLDVAFDDVEERLPLNLIRNLSSQIFSFAYDDLNKYLSSQVSRNSFKAYSNVFNSKFNNCPNLTIGSRYSAVMIRYYNKAVEQKMKDVYWWRLELQMRSEVAEMMATLILEGNFIDFYIDLLNKYSRFLDSTSEIVKVTDRPTHVDFVQFLNYLRGSFGSNNSLNINFIPEKYQTLKTKYSRANFFGLLYLVNYYLSYLKQYKNIEILKTRYFEVFRCLDSYLIYREEGVFRPSARFNGLVEICEDFLHNEVPFSVDSTSLSFEEYVLNNYFGG